MGLKGDDEMNPPEEDPQMRAFHKRVAFLGNSRETMRTKDASEQLGEAPQTYLSCLTGLGLHTVAQTYLTLNQKEHVANWHNETCGWSSLRGSGITNSPRH